MASDEGKERANPWGCLVVSVVAWGGVISLVGPATCPRGDPESPIERAYTHMSNFSQAITMYRLTYKRLPNTLLDLTQPEESSGEAFICSLPQDPWGNEYEYRRIGRNQYRIRSAGEDGALGTDDDIAFDSSKRNGER